jgi:hypothetical protein
MTPAERAAGVYAREPCARSFTEDIEAHLLGGFVHSTPSAFVLARPVPRHADPHDIVDPWVTWSPEDCDAWWIYLAAGEVGTLLHLFPFHTTWIGWERRNRPRFFRFQSALDHLHRIAQSPRQ